MANYSEQNTPLKFFKLIKQKICFKKKKIYNLKSRNYKTKTFRGKQKDEAKLAPDGSHDWALVFSLTKTEAKPRAHPRK